MEQYPSYKESGDEWIGEIPSHWDFRRLATLGIFSKGRGISRSEIRTEGLPCIRYGELYTEYDRIVTQPVSFISTESSLNSERIESGDVLFTGSGETLEEIGKSVAYLGEQSIYAGGDLIILKLRADISPLFMSFLLNSHIVNQQKTRDGRGGIIMHIYPTQLREIKLTLPPLPEQEAIASFLDRKTNQIDDLIAKKERLIELKKEERAAIINQAVTKGLDPNLPMKDSGIEWLGEIPEHWEMKCLKRCMDFTGGYAFSSADFTDSGIQLIKIGNLYQNVLSLERQPTFLPSDFTHKYPEYTVRKGDILMSLTGTLGKRDYGFAISISEDIEFLLNQRVGKLIPMDDLDKRYALNLLHSDAYLEQLFQLPSGTKQGNFSEEQVLSIKMGIPPYEEQLEISSYLDELTQVNTLQKYKYQAQIQLLKEYKTTLISEAVTGKIKVE